MPACPTGHIEGMVIIENNSWDMGKGIHERHGKNACLPCPSSPSQASDAHAGKGRGEERRDLLPMSAYVSHGQGKGQSKKHHRTMSSQKVLKAPVKNQSSQMPALACVTSVWENNRGRQ